MIRKDEVIDYFCIFYTDSLQVKKSNYSVIVNFI